MQTNCNEVVVLQQGEHSSVNNYRPAGKEVTGARKKGVTEILEKMKKREREVKVQLKREPLIISTALTKDRPFYVMVIQIC